MSQFNVTTTGTVPVVAIDDLHLTLTHPQSIDLRNDVVEKFSWAELLESDDLQAAIEAGEVNATDEFGNPLDNITLDRVSNAITMAVSGTVQDMILDGVTTVAPSQNAVFDALALKLDTSAVSAFGLTLIDDVDAATARTTLGLGTAATSNVGDFATAAQGALADTSIQSVFGRTTAAIVAQASDYDDSQVDFTYTPSNFTATNAFVSGALEGIDNALGAIAGDGNETPIVRGDAVTGVAPTALEVPSPESGDTASVFLTDGQLEKWVYDGTTWNLAFTLAANEATNLSFIASPTNGTITSSTGTDAVITLVDAINAGLMSPADFTKLGFISVTQAVDLDELEAESANLVTLTGLPSDSTTTGGGAGSILSDGTILDNLQELEAAVEANANVYGTEFNLFQDLTVSTTTSTTFQNKITGNTTALPIGTYKILVSYSWNHNATQNDFEAQFLFDGAAVGQNGSGLIHKAEPKDSGGNFSGTGSSQQLTFTQAYYVNVTTAGVKAVALDFRTDNAGTASSIWDASIEIVRVS